MGNRNLYDSNLSELKGIIREAEYLKYTIGSLIYWDKITYMPPKGIDYRTKVMSFLADEQYKMLSGERFRELVDFFDGNRANGERVDAMIRRIKRNIRFSSAVPEDEYKEYIELIAVAEHVWAKAREEDNFQAFRPFLEKIFATFRSFAAYWGGGRDIYDALLEYYEEGLTTEGLDEMVSEIKPFLSEMVSRGRRPEGLEGEIRVSRVCGAVQEEKWRRVLEKLGFDFQAGRVDTGDHPTILANSPDDVRIVNSFLENDIGYGLTNILHSGGKGIYQQSIDRDLLGSFLAEPPSFAMEESIGRFYENIVGRSRGFIEYICEDVYGGVLQDVRPVDQVFAEVNSVRPSAMRMDADEFTYLLHVIIRYEIERDVINERLKVRDLPQVWKEKYREYLGVEPKNDREGVLQDIHWAGGYVGYFPSYIIANLASAQLKAAMERDLGDLDMVIETGRLNRIREWLTDKVFRWGATYTTGELIKRATGEPLKASYYTDYLRKKLSEVHKK